MDTNKNHWSEDVRVKLSTLWIFVMFNMAFADIVGFVNPGALEEIMAMKLTPELLLVFSILVEIPILMIVLSRFLQRKMNRLLNIIASVITMLFVMGGGSMTASYLFFATVEVLCMLLIIRYAWKWTEETR